MIGVHNEIARLNGRQFLQREGELARTGALAAEGIFMETVENLVVGEHTPAGVVVHESLVHSAAHVVEGDVVATLGEDGAQALGLLLRIGEYHDCVALLFQLAERVGYQVEILMVEPLGSAVESHRRPGGVSRKIGVGAQGVLRAREVEARHGGEVGGKRGGIYHTCERLLVGAAGICRRGRKAFGGDGLHALKQVACVAHGQQRAGGNETEHRYTHGVVAAGGHVGGHGHTLHLLLGKLGLYAEGADGVDLVAEEVDAVGKLVGIAEHIDYGAAHGELPGLIHIVLAHESVVEHPARELVEAQLATHGNLQGVVAHSLARGHTLGHGLGVGHHEAQRRVVVPVREGLGAEHLRGRVLLAVFYIAFVARGEEHHRLLSAEGAEVLVEVSGIVGRIGHDSDRGAAGALQPGKGHGGSRPCDSGHGHRSRRRGYGCAHKLPQPVAPGAGKEFISKLSGIHRIISFLSP